MISKTITKTTVQMLGVNRESLERETHVSTGFEDETSLVNDYCNNNENFVLCSHKSVSSQHKIKMTDREFVMYGNTQKKKGDFYRNVEFTKLHGIFCDVNEKRVYEDDLTIFSDENEKDIPAFLPDGIYFVEIQSREKGTICVFMSTEKFYANGKEI